MLHKGIELSGKLELFKLKIRIQTHVVDNNKKCDSKVKT